MTADKPDLAALEALVAKMTAGPWEWQRTDGADFHRIDGAGVVVACVPNLERFDAGDRAINDANGQGIVALRNAAPALLALARDAEVARKDLAAARALLVELKTRLSHNAHVLYTAVDNWKLEKRIDSHLSAQPARDAQPAGEARPPDEKQAAARGEERA